MGTCLHLMSLLDMNVDCTETVEISENTRTISVSWVAFALQIA